jgi:predicted metal-dependent HD superfamily phosphohydrolase
LINQINESKSNFSEKEYEKLLIASLFHDVIYEPMKNDNEEKSAQFFIECCQDKMNPDILEIKQIILDTKTHQSSTKLSKSFNKFDMNIVERDFDELIEWEEGIKEEFSQCENYKQKRLEFLESLLDKYINNTDNLLKLIDYVKKH